MQNEGYVGAMYRYPSQNNTKFKDFLTSFHNLSNTVDKSSSLFIYIHIYTVILGEVNARSNSWVVYHVTTTVSTYLEAFTTFHGF